MAHLQQREASGWWMVTKLKAAEVDLDKTAEAWSHETLANLTANVKGFRPAFFMTTKKIAFRTLKYFSRLSFGPDVSAFEVVHYCKSWSSKHPPSLPCHTLQSFTSECYYRFGNGANSLTCASMLTHRQCKTKWTSKQEGSSHSAQKNAARMHHPPPPTHTHTHTHTHSVLLYSTAWWHVELHM